VRYNFPGRGLIQGLVLSPLVFPMLVTGIAMLRAVHLARMHSSLTNLVIVSHAGDGAYVIRHGIGEPAADRSEHRGRRAARSARHA